jgi:hypothetical protein
MAHRIEERLPAGLLDPFQIMLSRVSAPQPGRIPVLWCHHAPCDLYEDHLRDGGWQRFARFVFVSNWQAQEFMQTYGIPWSRCQVIPNGIVPFPATARWDTAPAAG